jgi:hypothetical protein
MEVQTRYAGHLDYYSSVADAYTAWLANPQIEKISWTDETGNRQLWRPFVKGELSPETETFLCSLSLNYRDSEMGGKWWYLQSLEATILEVTPDASFSYRFCRFL